MKKYRVYGIATASWLVGEYEADSPEDAEKQAEEDQNSGWYQSLCHQCGSDVELGDIYKVESEEM